MKINNSLKLKNNYAVLSKITRLYKHIHIDIYFHRNIPEVTITNKQKKS